MRKGFPMPPLPSGPPTSLPHRAGGRPGARARPRPSLRTTHEVSPGHPLITPPASLRPRAFALLPDPRTCPWQRPSSWRPSAHPPPRGPGLCARPPQAFPKALRGKAYPPPQAMSSPGQESPTQPSTHPSPELALDLKAQPSPGVLGGGDRLARPGPHPLSPSEAPSPALVPAAQLPRAPAAHAPGPGRFLILPSRASSGKIFEECSNYLRSAREAGLGPLVQEVTPQTPGKMAAGPHAHPPHVPPIVSIRWTGVSPELPSDRQVARGSFPSSRASSSPGGATAGGGLSAPACQMGTRMSSWSGVTLQNPQATITVPEPGT